MQALRDREKRYRQAHAAGSETTEPACLKLIKAYVAWTGLVRLDSYVLQFSPLLACLVSRFLLFHFIIHQIYVKCFKVKYPVQAVPEYVSCPSTGCSEGNTR